MAGLVGRAFSLSLVCVQACVRNLRRADAPRTLLARPLSLPPVRAALHSHRTDACTGAQQRRRQFIQCLNYDPSSRVGSDSAASQCARLIGRGPSPVPSPSPPKRPIADPRARAHEQIGRKSSKLVSTAGKGRGWRARAQSGSRERASTRVARSWSATKSSGAFSISLLLLRAPSLCSAVCCVGSAHLADGTPLSTAARPPLLRHATHSRRSIHDSTWKQCPSGHEVGDFKRLIEREWEADNGGGQAGGA